MQVLALGLIFQFSNSEQTTVMVFQTLPDSDTLRSSYSVCMLLLMGNSPNSQSTAQRLWEPKTSLTKNMKEKFDNHKQN